MSRRNNLHAIGRILEEDACYLGTENFEVQPTRTAEAPRTGTTRSRGGDGPLDLAIVACESGPGRGGYRSSVLVGGGRLISGLVDAGKLHAFGYSKQIIDLDRCVPKPCLVEADRNCSACLGRVGCRDEMRVGRQRSGTENNNSEDELIKLHFLENLVSVSQRGWTWL